MKKSPKVLLTVRVESNRLKQLRALAGLQDTTVTALVGSAIDTLLDVSSVVITRDEIAAFLPVAEAIGKPISISLLLKIIQTQRES